jgi:hypothetical protein
MLKIGKAITMPKPIKRAGITTFRQAGFLLETLIAALACIFPLKKAASAEVLHVIAISKSN